ncbi:MAG: PorT family protein [Spirochaetaceae bacterium]|jgi:hypothetical protein|nr:PorT family protein [Spirochaetaceae bacterium]
MTRKFSPPSAKSAVTAAILGVLVIFPALLSAQTLPAENNRGLDYEGRSVVAVLPLAGDEAEAEMIRRFQGGLMESVTALGRYSPREIRVSTVIAAELEIPTDMPPVPALVSGARYALTGGVYPGNRSGDFYLQLWLWDMAGSTMIYTDDLVYDDIDGAMESLPGLVEWLFSHIHETVIETPAARAWLDPLFMFGIRAGLSPRSYIEPEENSSGALALNLEGGVSGAIRLTPLLSFQLEISLTNDSVVYRGLDSISTPPVLENEKLTSLSLTVPLLLKANFRAGLFRISPLAGFYLVLPLGKSHFYKNNEKEASYPWSLSVPLGFTLGIEGARQYGSGRIFTGLRYGVDFGTASIDDAKTHDGYDVRYRRHSFSLYLGYEFGFYDGKKLGEL